MQKLLRSLVAVGGLAGLVACGDDVSITGPGLAISGAPVTAIQVGSTVQLSANQAVTWASSAANVATVNATGLVTAVGAGTASITATSTANTSNQASVTITVTAPGVRNVTVSPPNAILKPGDSQAFVANVDADAGVARTVTWASSTPSVATVTTAGVVTAVSPGAATITATSTANTSVSGAAAITVRQPIQATISIQNITITGTPGNTANVNNIAGSIDVNMNVDPGEQIITRAEVLIDGDVACFQNLGGSQSQALRVAAAFEEVEDVIVSCQINTAAFSSTTGVADFFNGPHTLSARAIIAGGGDVATPSTPLIFNNISGVIATVTFDNGSDPAAAINPGTGLQWQSGDADLNLIGVSYVSGSTVSSVSCIVFGKSLRVIVLTNGTATVSYDEDPWAVADLDLGGYLSPAAETVVCPSAVLSNGQPMPTPSGSTLLNFGPFPGQQANAAMPELQTIRYDGVAPGVSPSANGVTQASVTALVQPMIAPWVNAATTLTPSATGTGVNTLGLPSLATLNTALAGAGNDPDEGVDAITVTVNVPAAGGTLPTTGGACNITGLTAVTTGSDLAETTVSSAFPARIVFTDGLGNRFCMDLVQAFGADFTAPTFTVTGPAANTGYNASGLVPAWAVTASDNASGFTATPLRVGMNRLNINNTNTCVLGGGTAPNCTVNSQQGLSFSGTGGSAVDGYYTTTINLTDAAGNSVSVVTAQLNALDAVVPTFTGGISLPAVIAGAATNTFTTTVGDNLDLGSIFGFVNYPGFGFALEYPIQTIGAFGPPLEQSSANLGYNVANWIRCLNAPGSFAVAANPPSDISLVVSDQTTINANTTTLMSGAFGPNAQACTGTVGNLGGVVVPISFGPATATYGTGLTQVDLDGVTVAAISSTTVQLQAIADVPLNSSADPFSRVDFYYQNVAGRFVKIGTAVPTLAQTQTNRTYTYNFTWDPAAPVQTGGVGVIAIGVDAQGDAVATVGVVVNIVP